MRYLFCLFLLATGCDDGNGKNVCGELADQPCCPASPEGKDCESGSCFDELNTLSCHCDNHAYVCKSLGPHDLSMPDLSARD